MVTHIPEEIAVIGGGLGGCLTTLMLARLKDDQGNQKYHVTLIEKSPTLLGGASTIASRLHLGGEYPLSEDTASHCLIGATIWKLLMPKDIYSAAPSMKFLVGEDTEKSGKLTVEKYLEAYEKVRMQYEGLSHKIKTAFNWTDQQVQDELFGSPESGRFYRKLTPDEYPEDYYGKVAGGFQSQERGLNVPKCLATIQNELEKLQKQKKITIRTDCQVEKDGIKGKLNHFRIHCKNGEKIAARQVVQAAWQGGPEITPDIEPTLGGKHEGVMVYKRAMLLVDLPKGWKTPPAFRMLDDDGFMVSPYNDKVGIFYLPIEDAAYRDKWHLTNDEPSLPKHWDHITDSERESWTQRYFTLLKERIPVLKDASNPRLIIRDTLNFQKGLEQRHNEMVTEIIAAPRMEMALQQQQEQRLDLQQLEDEPHSNPSESQVKRRDEIQVRQGLFTLYPTKATYAIMTALQAAHMVEMRSQNQTKWLIPPPKEQEALNLILSDEKRARYSLADMKPPRSYSQFFDEHPELDPKMLANSWPKGAQRWVDRHQPRSGQGGGPKV